MSGPTAPTLSGSARGVGLVVEFMVQFVGCVMHWLITSFYAMECMIDDILFKSGITILVICQYLFASANEIIVLIIKGMCVNVFFHARFQRGRGRGRGFDTPPPPPENSQKYRVSLQYWAGSPEQS